MNVSTPSRTASSSSQKLPQQPEQPTDGEQELKTLREQIETLRTANLTLQRQPPQQPPLVESALADVVDTSTHSFKHENVSRSTVRAVTAAATNVDREDTSFFSAAICTSATAAPSVGSISPSASSFVTNSSSLYSSVSAADDNKSVTSSCMRSGRSTRSSAVWASRTRVGIGAYFQRSEVIPDALEVKSILANSPAQACKLVSVGDYIIAVDGELVGGKSLSQLAEKVLGAPHSLVEISFRKRDTQDIYSVSFVRGAIAS